MNNLGARRIRYDETAGHPWRYSRDMKPWRELWSSINLVSLPSREGAAKPMSTDKSGLKNLISSDHSRGIETLAACHICQVGYANYYVKALCD